MTRAQMIANLCECEGSTDVRPLCNADDMPLSEGRHTSFTVFQCLRCQKVRGFPNDNLLLFLVSGPEKEVTLFHQCILSVYDRKEKEV